MTDWVLLPAGGAGLSPMVLTPSVMLGASIVVGESEVADVEGLATGALAGHGLFAFPLVVAPANLVVVSLCRARRCRGVRFVMWLSALAEPCAC